MTLRVLAASLALSLLAPLAVAEGSSPLAQMLGHVPAGSGPLILLADPVAARAAAPGDPYDGWGRLSAHDFSSSLQAGLEGAWEPMLGFGPGDVAALATAGDPPEVLRLVLLDEATAAGVPGALRASGYEDAPGEGPLRLGRGAADFAQSLAARNPADPFGGALGQASRIILDGPLLAQAAGWGVVEPVASAAGPWGGEALMDALGAATPEGFALVQALVLTDPVLVMQPGLPPLDPTTLEVLEALPEPAGPPFWTLAALADLGDGTTDVTLLVRLYPARADAEAAARRMAEVWDQENSLVTRSTLAETVGAPATTAVVGDGPFAAVLAVAVPRGPDAPSESRAFQVLQRAVYARDTAIFAAE